MNPFVSIIIPCFNSKRFLIETVNSVLNQTYKHYEIIIVDDGSTDETCDLIKSFGTKVRPVFSIHEGPSAARNKGTKIAEGEYIQYLDSDDLLKPDSIERRLNMMMMTKADIVYSDWEQTYRRLASFRKNKVITRRIEDIHPNIEIALLTDFWCPPAVYLFRKTIVEVVGGWNEQLPLIEDVRLVLECALRNARFVYCPGGTAIHRKHAGSLSTKNEEQFSLCCFKNAEYMEKQWRDRGNYSAEHKEALRKIYMYIAQESEENDKSLFSAVRQKIKELKL